jgi:DUF4097 and DUF4098 domain-containing protein YvlB
MARERITLEVPGHAELHLTTRSGRVTVTAEDRPDVVIESGAPGRDEIETDATGRIAFRSAKGGSAAVDVRCPAGSDAVIGTLSGKVVLHGRLGAVRITNMSGDIEVESAESLDVRTISGNVEVDRCLGQCRVRSKSGKASVGVTDEAYVSTISGQITLDRAESKVRAQSVSGEVRVCTQSDGDVAVQTLSGGVRVEVPEGVRPATKLRSLAGRPRSDCPEGSDCRIAVRSVSGKIEVVRG